MTRGIPFFGVDPVVKIGGVILLYSSLDERYILFQGIPFFGGVILLYGSLDERYTLFWR